MNLISHIANKENDNLTYNFCKNTIPAPVVDDCIQKHVAQGGYHKYNKNFLMDS